MRINGPLQRYPLLRIALVLIGGIAVGDACYPTLGTGFWLICACVGIALALLSKRAAWRNGCIFVITLTVGATLVNRSEQHADCKLPHGESHYEAIISNTPTQHGKTWRCDLLLTKLNGQPLGNAITVRATVLNDPNRPMQLQTGNGIIASSVLEKPQNRWSNAHFDYALWLRRHGYQAETFIPYWQFQTAEVPMTLGRRQRATLQVRRLRDRIIRHFASSSHADNQVGLCPLRWPPIFGYSQCRDAHHLRVGQSAWPRKHQSQHARLSRINHSHSPTHGAMGRWFPAILYGRSRYSHCL